MNLLKKILDFLKKYKMVVILIVSLFSVVLISGIFGMKNEKFTVTNSGRELVFFSMKGCSHCEDIKPMWNLLIQNYGNNNYIELKQVVAQDNPDLVKQYDVKGFPTILALKDGKINFEYKGDRSYEDLVRFMNHAMTD